MGGGSSDAAATLRLAAHAAGRPVPAELAPRLGADVASLLRPGRVLMTGAGEHVEPLAPPPPLGVLVLPVDAELSTPAVYREADRLGLTRCHAELAQLDALVRVGTWAPENDLQDAARSLCPLDRHGARRRARRGRRPRARLRLRPDRRRAVRRRRRPGPRGRGGERVRLAARGGGGAGGRGLGGGAQLMHPFPLAGAIGLAIFLAVRFRRLGRTTLVLGVAGGRRASRCGASGSSSRRTSRR